MFKSNILLESSKIDYDSDKMLESIDTYEDSYLYKMLEFNNDMHKLESRANKDYYKYLVEAYNNKELAVYNESSLGIFIVTAISTIIAMVAAFIGRLFKRGNNISAKAEKVKENAEKIKKEGKPNPRAGGSYNRSTNTNTGSSNKSTNTNTSSYIFATYTFIEYNYPDIKSIDPSIALQAAQNIMTHIDLICTGSFEKKEYSDKNLLMAYKILNKLLKKGSGDISDSASFRKFVQSNEITADKKEFTRLEAFATLMDNRKWNIDKNRSRDYKEKVKMLNSKLNSSKIKIDNATKSGKIDESMKPVASKALGYLKTVINDYIWYINAIQTAEENQIDEYLKLSNEYLKNTGVNIRDKVTFEQGSIHGEDFGPDTLFDNEDMRDFNRTEWMDLSLTTECFSLEFELDEAKNRLAVREAMILTDDDGQKIQRLHAMREAEAAKTSERISGIIANIKQIITQFIGKLKNTVTNNVNLLRTNSSIINNPIKLTNVKSRGDILAGIQRLQKQLNIIPFDYNSMKDSLTDKKEFFQKYILPSLKESSQVSKRSVTWDNNMKITDYCKAYYGAGMDTKLYKECEFTSDNLEASKQAIIQFLNKPNILNSINTELKRVEAEAKKVSSVTTNSTNGNANNNVNQTSSLPNPNGASSAQTAQNNQAQPQNASYYSTLYDAWIHELDYSMPTTSNKQDPPEGSSGDGDIAAAFRTYSECYKDVFMSKLTACEFVTNELMALMNAHIQSYSK